MFEPNYTRIVSSVRKNIGITQSVVEVKLQSNEQGVKEVYSVGAKSTILRSEVSGNDIVFNGLIDFQTIIEGEGAYVSTLDYSAEFKDKFVGEKEISGEVILTSNVIDITSQVVSNVVKVTAIVETTIDIIESVDKVVLTGINGEVESITKDLKYYTYIGKATEKFDISDDIKISGMDRVYMVTPCVSITNVVPKTNFVAISGKVNIDICYGNGDDIRSIASYNYIIDFDWEVALDGIDESSYIQSAIAILTNEMKVTTSIEDGNGEINVSIPLNYTGYVFKSNLISVIDDVFSKSHYLSITSESVDLLSGGRSISFKDNVGGVASISDSAPFIDDVVGVCANNIVVASCNIEGDKLTVEGIANSTVLYYTKDSNSITSVRVEMPFVVDQKVEGGKCGLVTICLNALSAKSRRGKEIEVSADLNVFADMYQIENDNVISDVKIGEEKPIDECSLYIYIVKPGDTLWDIAKEMNVSEDIILEQNPDVQLPLIAGTKLIIYNPRIVMFE